MGPNTGDLSLSCASGTPGRGSLLRTGGDPRLRDLGPDAEGAAGGAYQGLLGAEGEQGLAGRRGSGLAVCAVQVQQGRL